MRISNSKLLKIISIIWKKLTKNKLFQNLKKYRLIKDNHPYTKKNIRKNKEYFQI
jgi:hypothetical protein